MGPIGRIKRCAALLEQRLEECFARFGMTMWEFDVLATLRRSGAPFCLTPTALFSTLMVTSGTMTHRMKSLETRGLLVQLTAQGLELIDRAVEAHLDNERQLLAPMAVAELAGLDQRLSLLLRALEGGPQEGARPAP
jgi:DNA-binding MarR family transcriptional regulator